QPAPALFFSSRRPHTIFSRDWSSDVCSSDLGQGISREGDILDRAVAENLIEKAGSWYAFEGERIGQGRENARQYLIDHPEIADRDRKRAGEGPRERSGRGRRREQRGQPEAQR